MIYTAFKKHSHKSLLLVDDEMEDWAVLDSDQDAIARKEQRETEEFYRRNH